jgi:adenylate cyclase
LRLVSGLWLFLFAATHLLNHALGLVSLGSMEAGRTVFLAFWRLPPVEASLALALVVHPALGLWRLWERRSFRMSTAEAVQLVLGLLIPLYLVIHVLGTGWLHRCCGVDDSYAYFIAAAWPGAATNYVALVVLVWLHGVVGVHHWFRLKPGYRRLQPGLLVVAALLPTLAIAGFVSAGRELETIEAADPATWSRLARSQPWASEEDFRQRFVRDPEQWIVSGFYLLAGAILLLRGLRWLLQQRRLIRLDYPGGREVRVPRGLSVLEASLLSGIPHAAVCGGRGRCSTCRVRIGRGGEHLPAPREAERRVLARIGAPPDVRLACQIRPTAPLALTPLLPASTTPRDVLEAMSPNQGAERVVAVLFGDLRDFTRLSERRLPYDTVFILNRYFAAMGEAIEGSGGRIDKFIGDGVMAVFGLDPPEVAALQALAACHAMARALARLNEDLAFELDEPLRMGIGLHLGPAILGSIGYGRIRPLTAIGDTVNVASRLEALTKDFGCQLVVSEAVARHAGNLLEGCPSREVDLRGRTGRLPVRLVADAASLPVPVLSEGTPQPGWLRPLRAMRYR